MPQYLTFLVSQITQLGCCVSWQVTEVSTFILHLKLYSLPVSLYRRDLQQCDQFLALKVSRNHLQNSLNSALTNNYEVVMFSRALCIILPPPRV